MMNKLVKGMGLMAACVLAWTLPVYAATESVSMKAAGNKAEVALELRQTGVSGNQANYDEIHSLQLSFHIQPIQETVSFEFAEGIQSEVKEYRYQEDTGNLNIYISGQQDLFDVAAGRLVLGKVVLDKLDVTNDDAVVHVIEDSLKVVNAAYFMKTMQVDVPENGVVVGKNAEESTPTPGVPGNPGTPDASGTVTPSVTPDASETPTPSDVPDATETPSVTPTPSPAPGPTDTPIPQKRGQKPIVKPASLAFTVGDRPQTLLVSGAKGTVRFSVNKENVVTVNSRGKVTPKAAGRAVITIKASGNSSYLGKTLKVRVVVHPKKPARVTKVKAAARNVKGRMKVTWKKTSATGFQIRYSKNKNMKNYKIVKVAKSRATSKIVKKAVSGKYSYVQVRAYRTKNGATSYGKWSKKAVSDKVIK